jgi:hypothetical protein
MLLCRAGTSPVLIALRKNALFMSTRVKGQGEWQQQATIDTERSPSVRRSTYAGFWVYGNSPMRSTSSVYLPKAGSVTGNAPGSRIAVAPVSSPTRKVLCGYLPQDTNQVAGSECNGWRDHGELEVLSLAAFRCTGWRHGVVSRAQLLRVYI